MKTYKTYSVVCINDLGFGLANRPVLATFDNEPEANIFANSTAVCSMDGTPGSIVINNHVVFSTAEEAIEHNQREAIAKALAKLTERERQLLGVSK